MDIFFFFPRNKNSELFRDGRIRPNYSPSHEIKREMRPLLLVETSLAEGDFFHTHFSFLSPCYLSRTLTQNDDPNVSI